MKFCQKKKKRDSWRKFEKLKKIWGSFTKNYKKNKWRYLKLRLNFREMFGNFGGNVEKILAKQVSKIIRKVLSGF